MTTEISNIVIAGKGLRKDLGGKMCPRLICNDGFSISVQANEYAYCSPRNDDEDWYFQF